MVTVEYQTVGERPITRPVTGLYAASVGVRAAPARSELAKLLVLADGLLRVGELLSQLGDLGAQLLVLAAGVERLVEPVDQVARRLQRPARALLDRPQHG